MATLKIRLVTMLESEQSEGGLPVPLEAEWAQRNGSSLLNPEQLPMTQVQEAHGKLVAAFWSTTGGPTRQVFDDARRPQGVTYTGSEQDVQQLVHNALGSVMLLEVNPLHCCCGTTCVQYSETSGKHGLMFEVRAIDGLNVPVLTTRSATQDLGITLTGRTRYVVAACLE